MATPDTATGGGRSQQPADRSVAATAPATAVSTYAMGEADDSADEDDSHAPEIDLRPPEPPPIPSDFTAEDRALREQLLSVYHLHNPENVIKVNIIIERYRGTRVSDLWAQFTMKYDMRAVYGIGLLAQSLYLDSPFEHGDREDLVDLGARLKDLIGVSGYSAADDAGKVKIVEAAIEDAATKGSSEMLRMLCFRGVPTSIRPLVWQVVIGYLPISSKATWDSHRSERRALYGSYRGDFLTCAGTEPSDELQVEESKDEQLFEKIRKGVQRYVYASSEPQIRNNLIGILFTYARLNPGVAYADGMVEIVAILFHVMSSSVTDKEHAEADAFWCFNEVMVEIKEGFMESMDDTDDGINQMTEDVKSLLQTYDPELFLHLQDLDMPPSKWAFRWCAQLFAQDIPKPNIIRLWDSFLGDPRRFKFVSHIAVAAVLLIRDQLMILEDHATVMERLQNAPRNANLESLWRHGCAICSFERREPKPAFPAKPIPRDAFQEAADVAAEKASALAQAAAAGVAQVTKSAHEHVVPAVAERAAAARAVVVPVVAERAAAARAAVVPAVTERAAAARAAAATAGSQAAQKWQETSAARKEALESVQTGLASFWGAVSSTAADVAAKGRASMTAKIDEADAPKASGYDATSNALASASAPGDVPTPGTVLTVSPQAAPQGPSGRSHPTPEAVAPASEGVKVPELPRQDAGSPKPKELPRQDRGTESTTVTSKPKETIVVAAPATTADAPAADPLLSAAGGGTSTEEEFDFDFDDL